MDHAETKDNSTALNEKLMTSTLAFLLFVFLAFFLMQVYQRWSHRQPAIPVRLLYHGGQARLVSGNIYSTRTTNTDHAAVFISCHGLDPLVMNSIPTFIFESASKTPHAELPLECAVCLSEFEDGETGRVLPGCKHCFHLECIDMWLQSHRDCPLCRARVEGRLEDQPEKHPIEQDGNLFEGSVSIRVEEETGSRSGLGCQIAGVHVDCCSSSRTSNEQLAGQMEEDSIKTGGGYSGSSDHFRSDIESGPNRTLKKLFGS